MIEWIEIPDTCPICGEKTEIIESNSGTLELYCSNPQCPGKLVNYLEHFCSKKGLDIKGLSKATLEKLIEWGWVSTIVDIFLLKGYRDQWIKKSGFGEKSVDRILAAIEAARHPSLSSYIAALGIPLIGRTVSKDICNYVDTYDEFRALIHEQFDFCEWPGFGPEKRDRLLNFDYIYADYLIDRGFVCIEADAAASSSATSLEGKIFVVTGKLKTFKNRDEIKSRIEALGGKVTESISSKTNYLINNDVNSASAKNKKAKELNIPIITEEEFLNMLN